MFVFYEKENQRIPIKIWLNNYSNIEPECMQQALNLSNLPFVYKHVALMPDTHCGYGMPIGGVIATENVIIPNAVGVDIGCGMGFVETNIHKEELTHNDYTNLIGQIMRNIPTGFSHHSKPQPCLTLETNEFAQEMIDHNITYLPKIEEGYYQIGTLGGGNHFIELQEDENGMLCVMLHTGSRNFGYKVCKYFNEEANFMNKKWFTSVPENFELAFLPLSENVGQDYLSWMKLAMLFAQENRYVIMDKIKDEIQRKIPNVEFNNEINAHHNYANIENHFGKNVWVHRKGAIRAREGEWGIIPGAMGSYSYIVKGLGNPESFMSCSHGAGRAMSRKKAKENYSVEQTILDLKEQNIVFGKNNKKDCNDECRWAYKDIDEVINNELDLIVPIKKLKTLAVIKG
jgi:tRNA-splicing ligase RtcB